MNIMKNQLSSQTFQAPAFRGADQPVPRYKKEGQKQGFPILNIIFKGKTKIIISISFFQIAAQNCRKRKLEQICVLETDLSDARTRKEELVRGWQ